jgi:NTP pyrophosphatase (non-canonical NTP hydrolase)
MKILTFDQLRKANVTRCNATYHHLETWSPTDWATAMAGECGEACNVIKKIRRLEDGPDKSYNTDVDRASLVKKAADELADLVIYADLLACRLGIDLGDAVVKKFNEVSERVGSEITIDNAI